MIWFVSGVAAALFAAVFAFAWLSQAVASLMGVIGLGPDHGDSNEAMICVSGFIVCFVVAAGCLAMAALQTVQGLIGAR